MTRPVLLTFDVFGTVIDWRRGVREALRRHGAELSNAGFDRVIDAQTEMESGAFRPYVEILASSLVRVAGIGANAARSIAEGAGRWPLYPDARTGFVRLLRTAPCVAITNSDQAHGRDAQRELGFDLSEWISAEETRCYKPDPAVWHRVAARRGVRFGPHWWHVSAYSDYDLETARRLGLTCVFVSRPHARYGPAHLIVRDLEDLARRLEPAPASRSRSPARPVPAHP